DKKRRDEIEVRNRADQAVYGAERLLKDTGDKLSPSDKAAIESAMEAVKHATSGTDAAAISSALDQLTQAQHKAAESLYKQQAGVQAPCAQTSPGHQPGRSHGVGEIPTDCRGVRDAERSGPAAALRHDRYRPPRRPQRDVRIRRIRFHGRRARERRADVRRSL